MIELPEARTIAKDLRKEIVDKKIMDVRGNFTDHKFTFYYGDPTMYKQQLLHKKVTNIKERNFYVEIEIEDYIVLMRDGANIRMFTKGEKLPKKSKFLLAFTDGTFLNVTTSLYACIFVFHKDEDINNAYYNREKEGLSPIDKEFTFTYFKSLIDADAIKLSIKAFIATEQRFLGVGNGVAQDIMFHAKLHPKRKMNTLSEEEIGNLYQAMVTTLGTMIAQGGRDSETTIYGTKGGYLTILSKNTYKQGCKVCHSEIKKEQYLGGSIYYCPVCQVHA